MIPAGHSHTQNVAKSTRSNVHLRVQLILFLLASWYSQEAKLQQIFCVPCHMHQNVVITSPTHIYDVPKCIEGWPGLPHFHTMNTEIETISYKSILVTIF